MLFWLLELTDLFKVCYFRVEKMKLSKDTASLRVNDSLTLAGIPPEVFGYRLGTGSATGVRCTGSSTSIR